jgi:putative spermidine/putrescine transport system substrate-binding protein
MSPRFGLVLAAILCAATGATLWLLVRHNATGGSNNPALTVVTFGGQLRAAQIEVLGPLLQAALHRPVLWAESEGYLAPIDAQVSAGNVVWDVVSLDSAIAVLGCERGLLEPLSSQDLGGLNDAELVTGARSECGVGGQVWSLVVAYRCDGGVAPTTIEDFFDLKRFPGRRALERTPRGALEWAMLADGVAPRDIYAQLSTEAGLARAFHKLDSIRHSIIWWDTPAQAAQLVMDREVVMTGAPSGRIALAVAREHAPLCVIWDGQQPSIDMWTVVRGTPHRGAALQFIQTALTAHVQASLALRVPYAPTRLMAESYIGVSSPLGIDVRPWLATYAGNNRRVIASSPEFWADRFDDLYARFAAWVDQSE